MKNVTQQQFCDPFGTAETVLSTTARSAIKRTVRTLATAKNFRKQAAISAVHRAKNAAAFYKAWSFLASECCDKCNKKDGLLHNGEGVTATDPGEQGSK